MPQQRVSWPRLRIGEGVWCEAGLDDVKSNLLSTGYPENKIVFIPGNVEETLPGIAPEKVALLRLDIDWYESTKHELEHLYSRVSPTGIIIIDDYAPWQGARKAVGEYLATLEDDIFLQRIDQTGRILVKPYVS